MSAGKLHPDVVALAMNRDPWRLFRRETQTSSSPIVYLPRSVRYADAAPPQSPRQTQSHQPSPVQESLESETFVSSCSDKQTQSCLLSDQPGPASDEDFVAASTTAWTPGTPDPASDCFEGPPAKSRCLSSVASDCSMSNETVVTLGSVSGGDHRRHRKPGDCRRLWHSEWETAYLVRYDDKSNKCVCLKCNKTLETVKKYTFSGITRVTTLILKHGVLRKGNFL